MRRLFIAVSIGFVIFGLLPSVMELSAASFYEGQRLTIVSGHKPGGGYDRMARLLAKHLPKHIPGRPSVAVQNMPGAGSIIAANHIFNLAKPDGLTIGSIDRGLIVSQLMKEKGVKFDLLKYAWIGSTGSEPTCFFVRNDLPYKTFNDLLNVKEPIPVGDIGIGNYARVIPLILRDYAGLKVKMITYPGGSRDIRLALERKEIDAAYLTYSSHKPYVVRGMMRPLFRGSVSVPEVKDLPVNEGFVKEKMPKALMGIYSAVDKTGRPYIAPPGTPEELMKIIREAFKKLNEDSEFKTEVNKVMMSYDYVTAEELVEAVSKVLGQPENIVNEFIRYSKQ